MKKITLTYENYAGEKVTEDFYFNINKMEQFKLNLKGEGDLEAYLRKLIAAKDYLKTWEFFEDLVYEAYGVKSPDGLQFIKTPEIKEAFKYSAAFPALIEEIMFDEDKVIDFLLGVIPPDAAKAAKANLEARKAEAQPADLPAAE